VSKDYHIYFSQSYFGNGQAIGTSCCPSVYLSVPLSRTYCG